MAILDEDRVRRTDDYIDPIPVRESNPVATAGLIIVALVLAVFAGWYFFADRSVDGAGVTRTSPPVTGAPTSGTGTTSNPSTAPKQP